MGYTHYFRLPKQVAPAPSDKEKAWTNFIADCRKVIDGLPPHIRLCDDYYADTDDGSMVQSLDAPELNDYNVRFNGIDEEGHETFCFCRENTHPSWADEDDKLVFNFCKTAYKDYDLAVCAVLIVAKNHFGDTIEVTSDGEYADWKSAFEYVESLGLETAAMRNYFAAEVE